MASRRGPSVEAAWMDRQPAVVAHRSDRCRLRGEGVHGRGFALGMKGVPHARLVIPSINGRASASTVVGEARPKGAWVWAWGRGQSWRWPLWNAYECHQTSYCVFTRPLEYITNNLRNLAVIFVFKARNHDFLSRFPVLNY